jgi:hypothetical protein
MILAPRSCPSRPGLAISTRILRSDISTPEGWDAVSLYRSGRFLFFHLGIDILQFLAQTGEQFVVYREKEHANNIFIHECELRWLL